ncbi:hypothetical protein HN011_004001 [Eciton burchellii]|nr:hypothetical protein HN011_004001 [Eciton burchellii]
MASWKTFNFTRQFATSGHKHTASDETVLLWKRISLFLGFPAIILASVNAYLAHKEHEEKHVQPEFIPYEHLRIRTKPFPWGDGNHTLFHNKKYNPLPLGYEE